MNVRRWVLAAVLAGQCTLGFAACRYDIDKIYKHEGGPEALPADLIDLWKERALPEECLECARANCVDENVACRDDQSCVELTKCVAKAQDPAAQNACRAEQVDWLREDIAARETGGPYHQCVFRLRCGAPCGGGTELACTSDFSWPKAREGSDLSMHLRVVEGLLDKPAGGVNVRACRENTETCLPLTDWAVADNNGEVDLTINLGLGTFNGYLELKGAGLYPSLMRFGWPIANDLVAKINMVSEVDAGRLLLVAAVPQLEDRGFLQLLAFGCGNLPTRDIGFTVDMADEKTADWYTAGDDPFPSFALDGTGNRGAGGIVNVVPGRRIIAGTTTSGEPIASNVSAPVRAGYMTVVHVLPDDSDR